jgi:hypothetical protein
MAKISKAGVYSISMADYHGQPTMGPSVSSSGPADHLHANRPAFLGIDQLLTPRQSPRRTRRLSSSGRAAHHLLLGEDDFSAACSSCAPRKSTRGMARGNGNNKTCKKWIADQAKAGRTVLTPAQIENIRGMARALAAHPLIDAGILNGEIEQSRLSGRTRKPAFGSRPGPTRSRTTAATLPT